MKQINKLLHSGVFLFRNSQSGLPSAVCAADADSLDEDKFKRGCCNLLDKKRCMVYFAKRYCITYIDYY